MDDMCLVYNINLCRICQSPENVDLINTSTKSHTGATYLDLLKSIFQEITWVEDHLPSLACQFCIKKIKEISDFKTICLVSNNRRSGFNVDHIKFEAEEVDIEEIPELKEIFDELDEDGPSGMDDFWQEIREKNNGEVGMKRRADGSEEGVKAKIMKNNLTNENNSLMRLRVRKDVVRYSKDKDEEATNATTGSFECPICHVHLERTRALDRHVFKHTGIRTYTCDKCNVKFITQYDLKCHTLNNCSKVSSDNNQIEIKQEVTIRGSKRRKERGFLCNICHMSFEGTKPLDRHLFKHNGIRKYECESCAKQFITIDDMKKHVQMFCSTETHGKRRGPKPKAPKYVCSICDKRFDGKTSLERHIFKHNGLRNYSCDDCGKRFITNKDLKVHGTRNYCNKGNSGKKRGPKKKIPRFVCEVCNKNFESMKPLERHLYRHNGTRNYACNGCETMFITSDDLKSHTLHYCNGVKKEKLTITGNHISRIRKYSCELCPTDFDRLSHYERHMYQHNGVRKYACAGCRNQFVTRESLAAHLRHHCTEEKLSCFLCPDKMFTPLTLEVHMKVIHMIGIDGKSAAIEGGTEGIGSKESENNIEEFKLKRENCENEDDNGKDAKKVEESGERKGKDGKTFFKCHYCSMEFTQLKHLDRHVYNHDGRRNYVCNDCGTKSITIDNLRSHMRIVHANKQDTKFLCTECGAIFPQSSGLKYHVTRIHANVRNFTCDICNKAFCVKRDLQNHMKSHSDVREFKCDLCPAQYKRKDVLLIHKTKRHGIGNYKCQDEKKHICSFCDKRFNVREKLNRHIRSHTGVKPFKCRLCDMKFTDKSYIKGHVLAKHRDLVDEHDFEVNSYCEITEDLMTPNALSVFNIK